MDFFNQGIPLGRWFRITVVIHWTFLLYAANELFLSRDPRLPLGISVLQLTLLFGTVLVHEFGHALSCRAVGGEALHIILWPLGGIAFVQPPMNPTAWLITTVCGPLVNAILWPVFWYISNHMLSTDMLVGNNGPVAQYIAFGCILMTEINRGLLLFNLIPAYPMDGGRMLQEILWFIVGYGKSLMIAGMVGVVAGAAFVVLGLGWQDITIPVINLHLGQKGTTNTILIIIGILCAMQSWGIYQRSMEIKGWRKN